MGSFSVADRGGELIPPLGEGEREGKERKAHKRDIEREGCIRRDRKDIGEMDLRLFLLESGGWSKEE